MGLGGMASVEALDERWGTRWRSLSERQYYSMRRVFTEEIKRRIRGATGLDKDEVVEEFEQKRLATNASLNKVIKTLKAVAKTQSNSLSSNYLSHSIYLPLLGPFRVRSKI